MFEIIPAEISGVDFGQPKTGFGSTEKLPVMTRFFFRIAASFVNRTLDRHRSFNTGISLVENLRERMFTQEHEREILESTLNSTLEAAELTHRELGMLRIALGVSRRKYSELVARQEEALSASLQACEEASRELDALRSEFTHHEDSLFGLLASELDAPREAHHANQEVVS